MRAAAQNECNAACLRAFAGEGISGALSYQKRAYARQPDDIPLHCTQPPHRARRSRPELCRRRQRDRQSKIQVIRAAPSRVKLPRNAASRGSSGGMVENRRYCLPSISELLSQRHVRCHDVRGQSDKCRSLSGSMGTFRTHGRAEKATRDYSTSSLRLNSGRV
ncbi:hypothetical protein OBBRIDRAFT_664522 [Obba rivulosa]|uniref:Uncharacterized protein n=1 Tax=Obba rivulosa TaxID=1052685 RepID=A0A8E2DJL0_9APHY|nr:hypothetical protein OBBRIDRAFT_664522 [Obba rivulosa]